MIRQIIYLIVFIFSNGFLFSQTEDIWSYKTLNTLSEENPYEAGTSFNTFIASNSLNSSFIYALYGNQYIDNAIKNRVHLKSLNYAGNEDNFNIFFSHIPDSLFGAEGIGYRIGMSYNNHRDIRFTDDLFNLVFYGNRQFAGDTAKLDAQVNFMTYQELQAGLFKNYVNDENSLLIYLSLSLIKGQDFNSINIRNSGLFTAETGEFLDLDLMGSYQFMDTVKTGFSDFNGLGSAINFYLDYTDFNKKYKVNLSVENLGFIRWKNESHTISIDTSMHYEGIEILNMFDYNDSSYFAIQPDSIVTDFFSLTDTNSFTKVLPERVHLSLTKIMADSHFFLTIGMGYIYGANMKLPLFYTRGEYLVNENISFSLLSGYGGYSGFHMGAGAKLNILKEKMCIHISSNNFLGFIFVNNPLSQNICASVSYRF